VLPELAGGHRRGLFLVSGSCRAQPPPTPDADRFNQPATRFPLSGDERETENHGDALVGPDRSLRPAARRRPDLRLPQHRLAAQPPGPGSDVRLQQCARPGGNDPLGVSDSAIRTQMATSGRLEDLDQMLSADILKELADGRYTHYGVA
jgi:hypothetical protein